MVGAGKQLTIYNDSFLARHSSCEVSIKSRKKLSQFSPATSIFTAFWLQICLDAFLNKIPFDFPQLPKGKGEDVKDLRGWIEKAGFSAINDGSNASEMERDNLGE